MRTRRHAEPASVTFPFVLSLATAEDQSRTSFTKLATRCVQRSIRNVDDDRQHRGQREARYPYAQAPACGSHRARDWRDSISVTQHLCRIGDERARVQERQRLRAAPSFAAANTAGMSTTAAASLERKVVTTTPTRYTNRKSLRTATPSHGSRQGPRPSRTALHAGRAPRAASCRREKKYTSVPFQPLATPDPAGSSPSTTSSKAPATAQITSGHLNGRRMTPAVAASPIPQNSKADSWRFM